MMHRYEHQGVTWVDLESPTRDEVVRAAAEFGIEPHIAEELLLPSAKPRAEFSGGHIHAIMHFPALRHSHKHRSQEIDFVVGKNVIITVHYEPIDPLHKFAKVFEVNTVLQKSEIGHAGFLFLYMLKKLYRAVEHELEYVHNELAHIEEHLFSGKEVRMVQAISRVSRDLLHLRQTIEPHRDMLEELETISTSYFGEEFKPYLKRLSEEYYRVHNHIMRSIESAREIRKTNDSLLSTKQNETMKVLTILAVFTFPLTLLVALFSVRALDNPIEQMPHGFLFVVGANFVLWLLMFLYFKHRKWI